MDLWVPGPEGDGHYVSGTSYATPFVTAALALLLHQGQDIATASQWLRQSARDLPPRGRDPQTGWGLLQYAEPSPGTGQ